MASYVVSSLLDKFGSQFIKNYDKRDLKANALKGTLGIENIEFRTEQFEALGSFYTPKTCSIGSISAKIPYTRLKTKPIEVRATSADAANTNSHTPLQPSLTRRATAMARSP